MTLEVSGDDQAELARQVKALAMTIANIGQKGAPINAVAMLNILMVLVQVQNELSSRIIDSFVHAVEKSKVEEKK